MVFTGKTGADAVFVALSHICRVLARYETKLNAVIDAAAGAGSITAGQATTAHAFVSSAATVCDIFRAVAGYSNVAP